MPAKKKKYNARFPALRIKKIMQSDEEIGKVAQAVPIIISRTLELFIQKLLKKTETITFKRNAKTLAPNHIKQCIEQEPNFDFLRDLVKNIADHNLDDGEPSNDQAATSTAPEDSSNRSLLRSHSLGSAMIHSSIEQPSSVVSPNLINFYGSNVESNNFERLPKSAIQRNYSMPASTSTITSSNASIDGFPFKIEIKVPEESLANDLSSYSFPIASNSGFKIDFSNFNNQLPSNLEASSPKNHMDEDYDNI